MKIEICPETPVKGSTSDFLSDDVELLLNTPVVVPDERTDVNAMFTAYDKELMSFKTKAKRRTWPQPIR